MVQALLDQRAVPGSSNYFIGLHLEETDEHALQILLQHEWVTLPRAGDNYSFQLSMKTLELFTVQFGLQTPFKVFQRRPDLTLTDATSFELVLEVQELGFQHKEKTRQSESFFERGGLIRVCTNFHLNTKRNTCCHLLKTLLTATIFTNNYLHTPTWHKLKPRWEKRVLQLEQAVVFDCLGGAWWHLLERLPQNISSSVWILLQSIGNWNHRDVTHREFTVCCVCRVFL